MSYEAERHPRMLNLKVYGGFEYPRAEQFRINEKRLTDRYRDWSNAYLDTGGYPDGRGLILPCPHNLGEDWYPQAFKATVKNYDDFCFVREWKINWRNFTFVEEQESELDAALDEHLWRLCAEGLALLGF